MGQQRNNGPHASSTDAVPDYLPDATSFAFEAHNLRCLFMVCGQPCLQPNRKPAIPCSRTRLCSWTFSHSPEEFAITILPQCELQPESGHPSSSTLDRVCQDGSYSHCAWSGWKIDRGTRSAGGRAMVLWHGMKTLQLKRLSLQA